MKKPQPAKRATPKKKTLPSGYQSRLAKLEKTVQGLGRNAEIAFENSVVALRGITGLETNLDSLSKEVRELRGEISKLKSAAPTTTTEPKPPVPQEYVLTDADWQRVIDEKWLCEFDGEFGSYIDTLVKFRLGGLRDFFAGKQHSGCYAAHCRPLNRPGVMQPYFGQGMPVDPSTIVFVKRKNISGISHCTGQARLFDWGPTGCAGDIVAYMVLP